MRSQRRSRLQSLPLPATQTHSPVLIGRCGSAVAIVLLQMCQVLQQGWRGSRANRTLMTMPATNAISRSDRSNAKTEWIAVGARPPPPNSPLAKPQKAHTMQRSDSLANLTRAVSHALFASLLLWIPLNASPRAQPAELGIGEADLGGVVMGPNGPEAGIWVIAETADLPTKFAKIVVTDDQGRYLVPALPRANYSVWVRGYGLVDSPKTITAPGRRLDLTAVPAPTAAAAAEYFPAIYWYAMLKVPEQTEFQGGGVGRIKSQEHWLDVVKTDGCFTCHQLGNHATRTIPQSLGTFKSSLEAWERRIQSGQAMTQMVNAIGRLDAQRALRNFADWTDRIAAGELPSIVPTRPQGIERNLVIAIWDWSGPKSYLHDEISTDRRNPTLNAGGLIYGAPEESTDMIPVLDPLRHTATEMKILVRDPKTPSSKNNPMQPSPYWGDEPIWNSQASVHNPMFNKKGRVWLPRPFLGPDNPAFGKKASDHASAKLFPLSNQIGTSRCSTRKRESSPSSQPASRRTICSLPRMPITPYGPVLAAPRAAWSAGSTEKCSRRPATRPSRKGGPHSFLTRTVTANGTTTSNRTNPLIQRRTSGLRRHFMASPSIRPT